MDDHGSIGLEISAQTLETSRIAIRYQTWSELLVALKKCHDTSLPSQPLSFIAQRVLDCLVEKLVSQAPPTTSTYTFEVSWDARKSRTPRKKLCLKTWWFEELVFLNIVFLEKLVETMIARELDHGLVSMFLFYYRKSKLFAAKPNEKREISEAVIGLLYSLDQRSVSFKGLFDIYRAASSERVSRKFRNMLERLIGSQLDQATLDYLLVPAPIGKSYVYDVDMVLKLVKYFIVISNCCSRLNKVGRLMDSYLAEIALDSKIKHSQFSALVMTLPDCARESHDGLYQAMDMYFEVHSELCEESKISLCRALNYEKLSKESLKHLARNSKFPTQVSVKAFMAQSCKLTSLIREIYHLKSFSDNSWFRGGTKEINRAHDHDGKKLEPDFRKSKTTQSVSGHGRYFPTFCRC